MKNKKLVILISAFMSLIVLSSISLISISLISSSLPEVISNKPLNRGDNYEEYDLSSYFRNDIDLTDFLDNKFIDNNYLIYFNEEKFCENIEQKLRTIFGSITKFKNNQDNYQISVNYQLFDDNQIILLDIV